MAIRCSEAIKGHQDRLGLVWIWSSRVKRMGHAASGAGHGALPRPSRALGTFFPPSFLPFDHVPCLVTSWVRSAIYSAKAVTLQRCSAVCTAINLSVKEFSGGLAKDWQGLHDHVGPAVSLLVASRPLRCPLWPPLGILTLLWRCIDKFPTPFCNFNGLLGP